MTIAGIKALAFDTGGTVLDWHSGIRAALAETGAATASRGTGPRSPTPIAGVRFSA